MTLPTDYYFPKAEDFTNEPQSYINDLILSLQTMYQEMAQVANGTYRNYADVDSSQWVPTLNGSVSGTFTYTSQYGWALRQGLMVDIWGDITWSATTATGNLYVELPYEVTKSLGMPFVGVCEPSGITFTTGTNLVINSIPNTYRGEIWTTGSGIATANQAVVASGRLIFYNRYIGVSEQ